MLTLLWQINESFKKFGILDNTSNVLLAMITQEDAVEKVGVTIEFTFTRNMAFIVLTEHWADCAL